MAKACGIRIGARRFELIALDGSAKNPKISACVTGELPPLPADDPAAAAELLGAALKEAVRGLKLPVENVGLAIDSGLAAFRTVKLPFADEKKVEQVIKFEVESNLPQWNVDDVVIDWHVLAASAVESVLLVTAVPKDALRPRIAACEKAGIEPLEAELEATAMVNAAHQAGLLTAEGAQVLVHVGEATTSVAVVDGGKLVSMRAVHLGAMSPAPTLAEPPEEGAEPAPTVPPRDLEAASRRLRRELGRTLAGEHLANPVEAVYVAGFELPELIGESIDDVPIRPLDALPAGSDKAIDGKGSPAELCVAYGAALRELGAGILKPRLRREELHYAGKFERVELPLAVLSLLIVTLLLVHVIVTRERIQVLGEGVLAEQPGQSSGLEGNLQIWLMSSNNYMFSDPQTGRKGNLPNPPPAIESYAKKAARGEVEGLGKLGQMREIQRMLQEEILNYQRELGDNPDFDQPMSALEGSSLVLAALDELGERVGRISIRSLKATSQGGTSERNPEHIAVTLNMTFFAQDSLVATQHYTTFYEAVQDKPWCTEFEPKATTVLEGGEGISVEGIRFKVDTRAAQGGK